MGGAQVQSLTPTPHPHCPLEAAKKSKGLDHSTSQNGEIGLRSRRQNILEPYLQGLVKPVTPHVYTQTFNFF